MRILCLFSKHPRNITADLSDALVKQGCEVFVATPIEKKFKSDTKLSSEKGCQVLRIKTGDLFDSVNKYQKFISIKKMPGQLCKAISSYWGSEKFDLIITHTPFMADSKLIRKLKRKYNCPALLLLWDIFPQNAIDLGIMKKGILYAYLKHQEKQMLNSFDFINCMSDGNRDYLLKHYQYINKVKLMVNYNWGKVEEPLNCNTEALRANYGYQLDDKICLFGGNIGKPQSPLNIAKLVKDNPKVKFLFIVRGTEYGLLRKLLDDKKNVKFLEFCLKKEYEKLVCMCDVGLVSLDQRFTVPNFPSKTIEYLKLGLPVFGLLDEASAKDFGAFLRSNDIGDYILAKNVTEYHSAFDQFVNDQIKIELMKKNSYLVYQQYLDVDKVAKRFLERVVA